MPPVLPRDDATPFRPRSHVIADLSVNHVERFFIEADHVPTSVSRDYGYDLTVVTHDHRGRAESGILYLQLKASETLRFLAGTWSYPFKILWRHFNLWRNEAMPVFLIRYSVRTGKAYWLYLQPYFLAHPQLFKRGQKSATLLIPSTRHFDDEAVQYMVDKKRESTREAFEAVRHKS